MAELAARLDAARVEVRFAEVAGLEIADLLEKSAHYLRFWGQLGFGIRPELVDEEEPIVTPGGGGDEGDEEPPTGLLH